MLTLLKIEYLLGFGILDLILTNPKFIELLPLNMILVSHS